MSLHCICDFCAQHSTVEYDIKLNGISGTSGGILLPERLMKRHFCSTECFWAWVNKYNPNNLED